VQNIDTLLDFFLEEDPQYSNVIIPSELAEKRRLMRSLMNIRPAREASKDILKAQDAELQKQLREKGIVRPDQAHVSSIDNRLKLWQGDITRLKVDAIVNAANSQMLGCFVPLHRCIDNAIHSAAGIQMRLECNELMKKQGYPEPAGSAKITRGHNLPAKFVIHTVGPIIDNMNVKQEDEHQLASCYQSCLKLADENKLRSIAFCCISTGEYRFPNQLAAEIAIRSVTEYFDINPATAIDSIVFNVFRDIDYSIYSKILKCSQE
jgi:O-acetyl-ADP-ribose deacetylase (regulator of RNase III)